MTKTILGLLGLLFGCAACVSQTAPMASGGVCGAYALEGVTIVDPESGTLDPGKTIIIRGGVIDRIYRGPHAPAGAAVQRLDMAGVYASPALIDAHAHLFDARDIEMNRLHGVAALRNMDGWPWHLRLAAETASCGATRLATTGRQFEARGPTAAEMAVKEIIEEKAAGFDWVKLYDDVDGAALEELAALKARTHGLRITGHLPDDMPASALIESGVYDDVAHAEELLSAMRHEFGDDWRSEIAAIGAAMKHRGVSLTTTIEANQSIADQASDIEGALAMRNVEYAAPLLQAFWRSEFNPYPGASAKTAARLQADIEALQALTAGLHRQGVVILAGSDAPNPVNVPGAALHAELALLTGAGLSPAVAMESATSRASDLLFPDVSLGRIAEGAAAEIILTTENPLADITALYRPTGLMIAGAYLDAETIETEKRLLADAYAKDLKIIARFSPASAQEMLDAINLAPEGEATISEAGLTSLVWFYVKLGNLGEAQKLADKLVALYPESADAAYVRGYVERAVE